MKINLLIVSSFLGATTYEAIGMLIAELNGERLDAFTAERGPTYCCPNCRGEVVLKKGRKVVHHFAHKSLVECAWARGESRAHMEAKAVVWSALKSRGLRAEIEFVVNTMPGDRRADVMTWSPKGRKIAFELQHTAIGLDEIERRASSYARAGIAQIWIPFVTAKVWEDGMSRPGGWFVERYSPRSFERWVQGFNYGRGMWMYDPKGNTFWLGRLDDHQIYIEETSWYYSDGEVNYGGGFWKYSKRFKSLTLKGPYIAKDLFIKISMREAHCKAGCNWPAARIADLIYKIAPEAKKNL